MQRNKQQNKRRIPDVNCSSGTILSDLQEEAAFQAFSSDAFLSINKTLLKHYGLEIAGILGNLIDKCRYFKRHSPQNNGWFFLVHEQQCEQLGVTEYAIRKAKKILQKDGILETKRMGIPAKEWYKINIQTLLLVLGQDLMNSKGLVPSNSLGQDSLDSKGLIKENKLKENKLKENNTSSYDLEKTPHSNPSKKLNGKITPKQFDEFWSLYPKREGGRGSKGKAKTKWDKLCHSKNGDTPTWRQIKGAIIHQMKSEQWQNPKYIPMTTTWLNNSRWLDDPKELRTFMSDKPKKKLGPDEDPDFYADGNYAKPIPGKYADYDYIIGDES